MREVYKRIIASFLSIAMGFCIVMPALAVEPDTVIRSVGSFWEALGAATKSTNGGSVNAREYLQSIFSNHDSGCTETSNGFHTWSFSDPTIGLVSGHFNVYCASCGLNYKEYKTGTSGDLTEQDLSDAYGEYVSTLDTPIAFGGSSFSLAVYPSDALIESLDNLVSSAAVSTYAYDAGTLDGLYGFKAGKCSVSYAVITRAFSVSAPGQYTVFVGTGYDYGSLSLSNYVSFEALVDNSWTRLDERRFSHDSADTSAGLVKWPHKELTYTVNLAPDVLYRFSYSSLSISSSASYGGFHFGYELAPFVLTSSDHTISGGVPTPSTRPTSITGTYGTKSGDTYTPLKITTIVNEDNSTYYSPTTNTTVDLSGWTYDYSTRTYTLTTTEDNSVTVTYGDEYMTITEGDTVTNVYYLVESSDDPGGNTGDDPGTDPGGNTGEDPGGSSVLGKLGELIGTVLGGLVSMVEAIASKLLDALTSLASLIGDKLTGLVEMILGWFDSLPQLFSGFLDFLAELFSFLPPEMMTLLTVGLAAIVIIGIIKALRR